jgi:hypothetical protein
MRLFRRDTNPYIDPCFAMKLPERVAHLLYNGSNLEVTWGHPREDLAKVGNSFC